MQYILERVYTQNNFILSMGQSQKQCAWVRLSLTPSLTSASIRDYIRYEAGVEITLNTTPKLQRLHRKAQMILFHYSSQCCGVNTYLVNHPFPRVLTANRVVPFNQLSIITKR